VFLWDIQYNPTCVYDIEEGRGHMRVLSSQEVIKNNHNGALSYQLTYCGIERESMVGVTVNLLVCDSGGALYSVHAIVYYCHYINLPDLKMRSTNMT
jgi:hypothetical protein